MTPQAEFAQWLEEVHPEVFEALYARARKGLSGLGDGEIDLVDVTSSLDSALNDISFSAATDINAGLALQDFNLSEAVSTPSVQVSPAGVTSSSGVLSSLESVGQWLTSKSGLNAMANIGTAVLKTQGAVDVAHAQMAVIQAQAARANTGVSPAPISYTRDAQGNLVPVYNTGTASGIPADLETAIQQGRAHLVTLPDGSTGYTLDQPALSSVLGTALPSWLWIALAAGIVLAVVSSRG